MKKVLLSLATVIISFALHAQQHHQLPVVDLKTTDGSTVNTSSFDNKGKPTIISFWATWCKPCIRELTAISEVYEDWQDETGVNLIAVSIDDARNSKKVNPFISGQGWEYDIYLDENSDFKRAMNVNTIPHTFLLDGKNEVVWQHSGYAVGDEDALYELVQKLSKGEAISRKH